MTPKVVSEIFRDLQEQLLQRPVLKKMKVTKKRMQKLLKKEQFRRKLGEVLEGRQIMCQEVLSLCGEIMGELSVDTPKEGWLHYIYIYVRKGLFPECCQTQLMPEYESAAIFYLEVLHHLFLYEKKWQPFERTRDFQFPENVGDSHYTEEYERFRSCFREQYVYELMRIGKEIMPFDLLAHVAGVHYVAMHVSTQLYQAGVPIDLRLISGAAACHDRGKYGCRDSEVRRIPYLHYYYTDVWCSRNNLPTISHVAANHSTWDLELEDLQVEALVLIYADFRVKAKGRENGKEIMGFYSLRDSFQVILDKLDNVDKKKEDRYRHVYAKLEDFEDYMESLGVNVDFSTDQLKEVERKDRVLLNMPETVKALKHMTFAHNVSLMHKLSHEVSFGTVLEAARSAKNWKNSRAYINIFEEYFTYMTQKQKNVTLQFLYELLMHREGDIRRQAADLMGNIIVNYDEDYRKELPDGVQVDGGQVTSLQLWARYLEMIIQPDHKVAERHRRWIGYALKRMAESVLSRCKPEDHQAYLSGFLAFYRERQISDAEAFILLDAMPILPMDWMGTEEVEQLLDFARDFLDRPVLEIHVAILRFLRYLTDRKEKVESLAQRVVEILSRLQLRGKKGLLFKVKIVVDNWSLKEGEQWEFGNLYDEKTVSDILLENLKAATPWIVKAVNIEYLFMRAEEGGGISVLQLATHFSNLLKVSEQVTVRHRAGEALVSLAPMLTKDQRNEVSIELIKGLEIGEYEFSKYIPQYLGRFALYLEPDELDEFLLEIRRLLVSANERVSCVALDTVGIMVRNYNVYRSRFQEPQERFRKRQKTMLGFLLSGLANYRDAVSQEAVLVIGRSFFEEEALNLEEKKEIFQIIGKKFVALLESRETSELAFFNNAASLNYIYRFIGEYLFQYREFSFEEPRKIAFFPGTYDPFSLGHKEIARMIRDLGFTVYLALDEFSWSKKTQPHMIRREIIAMSVADEENIYVFPDDRPVNIATPRDLLKLRELFQGKEVYMVAGSDVVENASSYQVPCVENSIQTFPHILIMRGSGRGTSQLESRIKAPIYYLKLSRSLEDISSTKIRENIDDNRDISTLVDPVVQNYIYENSLYLREPQYKQVIRGRAIQIEIYDEPGERQKQEVLFAVEGKQEESEFRRASQVENIRYTLVRDLEQGGKIVGIAAFHGLATTNLYQEFQSLEVANHIRENTSGRIVLVAALFVSGQTHVRDVEQLLATDTLAFCLQKDYTYAVFSPYHGSIHTRTEQILRRQGFYKLEKAASHRSVYVVDMKAPIIIFQNLETVLKSPFQQNPRVRETVQETHWRLQQAMTKLYPGQLVLSFRSEVMYHRLVERITRANQVPSEPTKVRRLGPSMCVPFGKILRGNAVPNTVTKVLHTEKTFVPEVTGFSITEYPNYSPLATQVRTIKSFNRPVILVDDILHKGYRIKELNPLFEQENVKIVRIIVGVLSGRGKDLMEFQNRKVESVYFLPSIKAWFVESTMYPFIGGDSIQSQTENRANLLNSINLILPYVMPGFIYGASNDAIYDLSMTCLENSRDILRVLEEEYQSIYERNLTLNRLGEVVLSPCCPDRGDHLNYDYHLAPSVYVENDIVRLIRLKELIK
ncbi:MAG: nicotinate-nicotinamide nucleotide adenylyltransferase [Blautia sp.]